MASLLVMKVMVLERIFFFLVFLTMDYFFSGYPVCLLHHPQGARPDGDVYPSHPLLTEWEEPRRLVDSRVSHHGNVWEKSRHPASF